MNKVFSISVFGRDDRYIGGAIRQRELARKYFPEWEFRIYADDVTPYKGLTGDTTLVQMDEGYGVFWRFYPLFESDDQITIVRDSDSRITLREKMAVEEWLSSPQLFHTFKDHEAHYQFPIMAGTFGYKGRLNDDLYRTMMYYQTTQEYYLSDQIYLREHVWPTVESSALVHSMVEPGWFSETRTRLINPTSFCGNGYSDSDEPLYAGSLSEPNPVGMMFDEGALHEV